MKAWIRILLAAFVMIAASGSSLAQTNSYQGLWWAAPAGSESGWGINFTHQGDVVFATWFTYDASGKQMWLAATLQQQAGAATFSGDLYAATGPSFSATPFQPNEVKQTLVGKASVAFQSATAATFSYTVGEVAQVKSIVPQVFGALPQCQLASASALSAANNHTGLWWAAPAGSESGWGMNMSHQGDIIFVTWFTYGSDHRPMFIVGTLNVQPDASFTGDLYRTSGPAFNSIPFRPAAVTATKVGTATLRFADGNSASFFYTVDGITQTKSVTQQVFRDQVTICSGVQENQFVRLSGGTYVMGDHHNFVDPAHPSDEIPLHNVTVSPFYISPLLVTNSEYVAYLNAALASGLIEVRSGVVYATGGKEILTYTTAAVPLSTIKWANGAFSVRSGREQHPATGVRWFGAAAYANWLSTRDGYTPCYNLATGACNLAANGYRLPTEAEWEYAARGGQTNPYAQFPWGNDTNADGRLANWEGSGDPWENGEFPHTTPVGFYNGSLRYKSDYAWPAAATSYQTRDGSNAFGLYDMAGNVWEWVNDWYSSSYYQYCVSNNVTVDPPGPATGDVFADHGGIAYRGLRGGTWWNGGGQQFYGYSRVSNRNPSWSLGGSPDSNADSAWLQVGFRLVRSDRGASPAGKTVGLMQNTSKAYPGYTLMSPLHSTATYLVDNAGWYVHKWTSTGEPGRSSYLLENGHMIRASAMPNVGPSTGGGEGGRIEEYDWSGKLVWAFDYYSPTYIAHHDFKVLPNGNVVVLASEKKTYAEVLAAGFNPSLLDPSIASQGFMLPDYLVEVVPTKPYGGTIVWEWHVWDHLIQDFDATKKNFGVVGNHPELIDVNGVGGGRIQQFWNHANGIDYNAELDQIMISIRGNSELVVIDHGTSTAQSAGHDGGRYGKGGDVLYRWGYAQQYDRGAASDRKLYQQHHTHWIEPGLPGAGNILIFNNGIGRGYSSVDEIVPPVGATGNYALATGAAFGPGAPTWTYVGSPTSSFYSAEISGAQRLPNGNTLITEGVKGNLFEVTAAGEKVWQYINPVTTVPLAQGSAIPADPNRADQYMNAVFRVTRYGPDFAGLQGKDLTPIGPIETY